MWHLSHNSVFQLEQDWMPLGPGVKYTVEKVTFHDSTEPGHGPDCSESCTASSDEPTNTKVESLRGNNPHQAAGLRWHV